MKCPVCKAVDLLTIAHNGVEIDCCPDCNGIWLDQGELDKIRDRPEKHIATVLQKHLKHIKACHITQSFEHKTYEGREYGQNGYYMKKQRRA